MDTEKLNDKKNWPPKCAWDKTCAGMLSTLLIYMVFFWVIDVSFKLKYYVHTNHGYF